MKKIMTYVPIILIIISLRFVGDSLLAKIFLGILLTIAVFAKYKRNQLSEQEVEYDERIEANITKWSLKTLYFLNSLLIVLLLIDQSQQLALSIDPVFLILFLSASLVIPFYLIPVIMKKL